MDGRRKQVLLLASELKLRTSAVAAGYVADRSDKIRTEREIAGRPVAPAPEIRRLPHLRGERRVSARAS
jgi:hypothetical protein